MSDDPLSSSIAVSLSTSAPDPARLERSNIPEQKQDLMASLLIGTTRDSSSGAGLFGDDDDAEPPVFALRESQPVVPPPMAAPPMAAPPPPPSLLEQSGLLGVDKSGGGNGLFDDIEQEEAQKAEEEVRRMAEEARRIAEAERRKAEEEARNRAIEEERRRQAEEAARKAEQERQRQLQEAAAAAERRRQEDEAARLAAEQMQSIHLGHQLNQTTFQPEQQQQPQPDFYRSHVIAQPQTYANAPMYASMPPTYAHEQPQQLVPAAAQIHQQQPMQQPMHQSYMQPRYNQYATPQPNILAGMHNGQHHLPRSVEPPKQPAPVIPMYGKVSVSEPLLIQSPSVLGIVSQPPYWSYQITTQLQEGSGIWLVRRRFRHVVALEDKLRDECPGAILPPRPDKHAARAIEEASAHQSVDFAKQRANEVETYLNSLVHHPITCKAQSLRLFLALQDDLGTAWPEVSGNAWTRFTNAGVGAAVKVSEKTMAPNEAEDNAELIALQAAESVRMGAVLQAVPKLEGAVTLLREHAEQAGTVGLELNRMAKEIIDTDLTQSLDLLSAGMLRAGRRSKRLALELAAAMQPFSQQYKLCRYERAAFQDRRAALQRRTKERAKADQRASQLVMHQRQFQGQYNYGLDHMERDAAMMDDLATDAVKECDEIGQRLKEEVNRVAWERRTDWSAAVKVMASAMKEATSERVAIWTSVRGSFLEAFPEYSE